MSKIYRIDKYGVKIDKIGPWEIFRDFIHSYYPDLKYKTYKKFCKKIDRYNAENETSYDYPDKKLVDDHWKEFKTWEQS